MVPDKTSSIVIIGGGAAGVSMGYYLQKEGYSHITLLEKENSIGGMCCGLNYEGQNYGMGAIAVTPDYECLLDLIDTYGVGMEPAPYNILMDFTNGQQYPLQDLVHGLSKLDLAKSIARYFYELMIVAHSLKKPGFGHISDELAQPFSDWLAQKGLQNLGPIFSVPITCFGYGYLDQIPAAYALKYMDYKNFGTMLYMCGIEYIDFPLRWPKRLTNGLQNLLKIIAEDLPDVRTGVTIEKVDRTTSPIQITLANGDTVLCDCLVLALPLETDKLSFLELRPEEKDLFDRVFHNNYFTTACEVQDFSYNVFLNLLKKRQFSYPESGAPFMMGKWWDNSDMMIYYSYGEPSLTIADIQEKLKEQIASMGRKLITIHETKQWPYFSHVGPEDLKDGFYTKLEALQGLESTYYASKVMNFELVENSIAYSQDLVKRFFR